MRNDSSLNYNTPYSKVQNFKDFEADLQKEKDKLKKLKRNYKNNKDGGHNLANTDSDKLNYNKITNKTDKNIGKELVADFINDLEEKDKSSNHKYKLEKEQDLTKMESYQDFIQKKNLTQSDYSDDSDVTSYMFFGNLQTIHRLSTEILQMDQAKVNQTLDDGHNWAEDHITTAKVQISQVFNFLTNKSEEPMNPMMKEDHQYNYMFFGNLETISEQCEKMLSMDEKTVDSTLVNGHDWAEDHVASAKENIEQVHEFLQNEMMS